jgi:hypothetical protein
MIVPDRDIAQPGFVPNYYTSYIWDAATMTPKVPHIRDGKEI